MIYINSLALADQLEDEFISRPKLPPARRFHLRLILFAQQRFHPPQYGAFGGHAAAAVYQLPVFEVEYSREAAYFVLLDDLLVFVRIQLDEAGFAFQGIGGGGELGGEGMTGAAPVCPYVDDNGLVVAEYGGAEVLLVDLSWHKSRRFEQK
jgi:hypothetical protein